MRVLLVSAHFRPHVGGVETFAETLAGELSRRGHAVTVLCCRTDDAPLREDGEYLVVRLPASTWPERRLGVPYPLPAPRALASALRRELRQHDVVHVQDVLYPTSLAAILCGRRAGVPVLVTQHVGFVPQASRLLDALQRAAQAAVGPVARAATRVVAYNAEVAAWAERRWSLTRVAVLPVGVPKPVTDGPARADLGLDPDRFVAVFVGRDVPKKGLDVFLDAADPAYDLVAVTDRPGRGESARLLPFMPRDALSRLLASVDAFVLPSEAEGVPLALQEAMAHGLPVVATYDQGYAHVFSPTDIAAVERDPVSVRAALRRLAAEPAERARLAGRSRAVAASSFSLEAFADAYERLYAELLLSPGR